MPYVEPLSQYVACAIVPWCVLKSAPANVTYRMPRGPGATAAAATPRRAPTIPAAAEAMAVPLSSVRRSIAFPFLPARSAGYARSLEESQQRRCLAPIYSGNLPNTMRDAPRSAIPPAAAQVIAETAGAVKPVPDEYACRQRRP